MTQNNYSFTNKYQKDVALFHDTAGHPVSFKPIAMKLERAINRSVWTGEEIVEFLHASSKDENDFDLAFSLFVQGLEKAYKKSSKVEYIQDEVERIVAQSDALGDTNYFINGTFAEIGVDGERIHDCIQKANMSKFYQNEDGSYYAKFREDGKILKAPTFAPPEEDIKKEIKKQLNK